MNDIADNCEITRRTIYNYFENKTELLQFLIKDLYNKMALDFKTEYDNNKKTIENLNDFITNTNQKFLDYRDDIVFAAEIKNYLSYRMTKEEFNQNKYNFFFDTNYLDDIKEIIEIGLKDNSIRDININIEDMSEMLYQACVGYLTSVSNISSKSKEEFLEKSNQFSQMVIYYLENK